jgi:hypothetical protein
MALNGILTLFSSDILGMILFIKVPLRYLGRLAFIPGHKTAVTAVVKDVQQTSLALFRLHDRELMEIEC